MTTLDTNAVARLAEAAINGDRKAFTELVRMFMPKLIAKAYRMTGDREAARDLAQETMVAAWTERSSLREPAAFPGWLFRVGTNRTLNYLQSRARTGLVDEIDQTGPAVASHRSTNPEISLHQESMRRFVLDFYRQLPDQQRAVFELRFYQEMPFQQIAETIGKSIGTVKTHYRQAAAKLRQAAIEKGLQP